jgi:hypothetical protein
MSSLPFHPLLVLDEFLLQSIPEKDAEGGNENQIESNEESTTGKSSRKRKLFPVSKLAQSYRILEISEFLYGGHVSVQSDHSSSSSHTPSGSLLESAIELLDTGIDASGVPPVRLIRSKGSNRSFLVVRGSNYKRSFRGRSSNEKIEGRNGPIEYLCLMGRDHNTREKKHTSTLAQDDRRIHDTPEKRIEEPSPLYVAAGRLGYHCSCRSFMERARLDSMALCKHLLAARLAPFLCSESMMSGSEYENPYYKEELLSEEDFGKMYVRLSIS